MIRHIGYDRYFDFDAIFDALPVTNAEMTKIKRELKAHVPFAVGWHKKVWFKESDLEIYLSERFPDRINLKARIESLGIYPTILHYAGRDTIFNLLEDHHQALSRLYNRLHYFPTDKDTAEKIAKYENHVRVLRDILFPELKVVRNAREGFSKNYCDEYAADLLKTYRGMAWHEKRFDHETTEMLKLPERKKAS